MAKKKPKAAAKPAAKAAAPKARPTASQFSPPSLEAFFKPFQQTSFPASFEQAKEQFEKLGFKFDGSDELTKHGKENVEAIVKSSQILAKSAEELTKAVAAFTQASVEMATKANQAFMGVKSVQDLAEIQSELAKSSFDHFIAGASKISDMTVKVANEAMEPISQRINVAVEKITKVA